MLHAKMMPLLAEVYKGRIDTEQAKLYEYGGQKLEAQVVEGGVKFAAVAHVSLPLLRSCGCQHTDLFGGVHSAIWNTILLYTSVIEANSIGTRDPLARLISLPVMARLSLPRNPYSTQVEHPQPLRMAGDHRHHQFTTVICPKAPHTYLILPAKSSYLV